MTDFNALFLFAVLAIALFDGLSEGYFLQLKNKKAPISIDKTRKITDGLEFGLAAMAILITANLFDPMPIAKIAAGTFWALAARWLLRDGFQNLVTGQGFFYTGTVSKLDKLVKDAPIWFKATIKLACFIAFLILYFIL